MPINDISGFGLQANLVASNTFPQGIILTQFADDADPLDIESIQLADKAMGLNGDMVRWSKATPIPVTLNMIAGSEDDRNLAILAEANRVGQGKQSAQDELTLTIIYPNGVQITLDGGLITDAMSGSGVASAGRLKTKPYKFAFQNRTGGPA